MSLPDPILSAQMAAALAAIGALAGIVAGLLGVGGGIVMVPALFCALTALGFAGPGSCRSASPPRWPRSS